MFMQDKKCPVYKKCNGCQLMNMSYEEQLRFKEIKCVRSLGKYGRVEKIVPMDNPYFYRNKVQTVFRKDRHGNLISGIYQSSTGGIVGVEKCLLENEKATEIVSSIKKLIKKYFFSLKRCILHLFSYSKVNVTPHIHIFFYITTTKMQQGL